MPNARWLTWLCGIVILAAVGGCRQSAQPPAPPAPSAELRGIDSATQSRLLGEQLNMLATAAAQLPGPGESVFRQRMTDVFGDLADIVAVLQGPNPTGVQRQQVQILQSSQQVLATSSMDVAAEPTVNSGLRAAHGALSDIAAAQFADQARLRQQLDQVRATLDQMDAQRGPTHHLLTSDAVRGIVDIVRAVYNTLQAQRPSLSSGSGSGQG